MDIKRLKAANRMAELESLRRFGPQHGKGGVHKTAKGYNRTKMRQADRRGGD